MESFKNTRYFKLLHNSEKVSSEELEEVFQEFTQKVYLFCLNEQDKNVLYFTLQHIRSLLITLQASSYRNPTLPIKGAITFIEAALTWINMKTAVPSLYESKNSKSNVVWTGKIIHFIEWIYGPDSLQNFNNGNITLKEVVEHLSCALGIEVKNPGGYYVAMRDRVDESRTTYLDSMRKALLLRMEKDDEKKRKRN